MTDVEAQTKEKVHGSTNIRPIEIQSEKLGELLDILTRSVQVLQSIVGPSDLRKHDDLYQENAPLVYMAQAKPQREEQIETNSIDIQQDTEVHEAIINISLPDEVARWYAAIEDDFKS